CVRWDRGGGIKDASLRKTSTGGNTSSVRPSRNGRLSATLTRSRRSIESRELAIGERDPYWFFAGEAVARGHRFLDELRATDSIWEVAARIESARKALAIRERETIPI